MSQKKTDLAQALQSASGKTDSTTINQTPVVPKIHKQILPIPPSRLGKKAVTGFFDPAVSKQFKRLALDKDLTVQALLAEAINDVFIKYKQNPIA